MAIDYGVLFPCVPRERIGSESILERLKGRERAHTIIQLFRRNGDQRPPSQMGFELTRSTPEGAEETRVLIVQDMLDDAAPLDELAHHCAGCPANLTGAPYGCYGRIDYPISAQAERWLLDRLPGIDQPLAWLLLRQGVQELGYDGESVRALRVNPAYFEERRVMGRDMGEFVMTADQVFEMLFLLGSIRPPHAGILLLFFDLIPRQIEADAIREILDGRLDREAILSRFPLRIPDRDEDDTTISQLKDFFRALYTAWTLGVPLMLDV